MAPVCVRVAFVGGGPGEPSRWAGPHGAHRAARRASGIVANQNEKNCAGGMRGSGCLCSMVLRPVERLVFSPKER